jgi:predicted dehydrogenase
MKYAVFGLGFMGSMHLKALQRVPQAKLVAVVSDDPVKLTGDLSAIQGNLGGPGEKYDFADIRKYRNVQDAIRDREIEAVDICLPTHMHAPVAIEALRAGKHVLVEKPMALTGEQTDQMLAEAEEAGRVLMTAQVLRFFPSYVVLRERLRNDGLGQVRSAFFRRRCAAPAWARWQKDPALSGGGVFDLLIHDADFVLQLFGAPESVSAFGYEDMPRGIDWILAQLHYPGIASVSITGGWHHPKAYPFSMEYTVVADAGTVEYSSAGRAPTLYRGDGESEALPEPEMDGFQAEIEYFVNCAIDGKKTLMCPPQESAAAVKLTRLMVEARERQGERIPCNL